MNWFAYTDGNPTSNIDPLGTDVFNRWMYDKLLSAHENGTMDELKEMNLIKDPGNQIAYEYVGVFEYDGTIGLENLEFRSDIIFMNDPALAGLTNQEKIELTKSIHRSKGMTGDALDASPHDFDFGIQVGLTFAYNASRADLTYNEFMCIGLVSAVYHGLDMMDFKYRLEMQQLKMDKSAQDMVNSRRREIAKGRGKAGLGSKGSGNAFNRGAANTSELNPNQFKGLKNNGTVSVNSSGSNRPLTGTPNSYYSTANGEHVFVYDGQGKLIYDLSAKRVKAFNINVNPAGKEFFKPFKLDGNVPDFIKNLFGW